MPRTKPVSRDEAPPEIADIYDAWFGPGRDPVAEPGTSTGTPGDWWTTWARVPDVLRAMRAYAYREAPVDPRLREVALMRTGYVRASQFVFSQHCKAARREGVDEAKIAAVPCWTLAEGVFSPVERAVLAYVDGMMLEAGRVHDRVFAALRAHLSDEEILVLTYLVNLYGMHAISSKALRMEYDNVPERIVEIPAPEDGGVQDWRDPKWSGSAAPAAASP
ncbi:carboxymuconolactone decarboxylase family protein [Phenylobacterium sp.]|uniref:carboxymuconolactone decarboxylase family protein n=1 Tax=Phenylobacterium sp. TaxID=1871053 RepID=UPI00301D5541